MRVLVAFDKFKDALSARRACEIVSNALRRRHRDWQIDTCPLTDGGDGFEEILRTSVGVQSSSLLATGPRGGMVNAGVSLVPWARVPGAVKSLLASSDRRYSEKPLAVIELASASGLALLPTELRDPWQATTHGTGQLIRAAAELGAGMILLGVGGSATHDLGLGALSALGFEFRRRSGGKLRPPIPAGWADLEIIEGEPYASIPPIRIACDVSNPLLGNTGAAAAYARQKGLAPDRIADLDNASRRIAEMLCAQCGRPFALTEEPGAGAAGGTAFGLKCGVRAELRPGFDLVAQWLGLDERISAADLIITGEGRFDDSSRAGKGPGALIERALAAGKPLRVFAGAIEARSALAVDVDCITPAGLPLEEALRTTPENLSEAIARAFP